MALANLRILQARKRCAWAATQYRRYIGYMCSLLFTTLKPLASEAWILQELSLNPSPSDCPPAHLQGEINSPSSLPPRTCLIEPLKEQQKLNDWT